MCNLYKNAKSADEVAAWFRAANEAGGSNAGEMVYPGYPGMVVESGRIRTMNWGFPLARKGAKGQPIKPKPVNNARTDKLDSFFWKSSFEQRRCLIPLTAWAEAQGEKGTMTRTWLRVNDAEIFACAGLWRPSDEWGDCYSMVMTDAAGPAAQVHSRMPVILSPSNYSEWIGGSAAEARELCRAWDGGLAIEATREPWAGRSSQASLL